MGIHIQDLEYHSMHFAGQRKREEAEEAVEVKQEVEGVEALDDSLVDEQEDEQQEDVSEVEEAVPPAAKRPLLVDDDTAPSQHTLRKKRVEEKSELQLCLDYLQKTLQRLAWHSKGASCGC